MTEIAYPQSTLAFILVSTRIGHDAPILNFLNRMQEVAKAFPTSSIIHKDYLRDIDGFDIIVMVKTDSLKQLGDVVTRIRRSGLANSTITLPVSWD